MVPQVPEHQEAALMESAILNTCIELGVNHKAVTYWLEFNESAGAFRIVVAGFSGAGKHHAPTPEAFTKSLHKNLQRAGLC